MVPVLSAVAGPLVQQLPLQASAAIRHQSPLGETRPRDGSRLRRGLRRDVDLRCSPLQTSERFIPLMAKAAESVTGSTTEESTTPADAEGEAGEPQSAVERVSDDPVLRARAESRKTWVPPKIKLGEAIVDVLYVFGGLLDRPFGSGQSLAAAGAVVVARVRAEVGAALPQGTSGVPQPETEEGRIPAQSAPLTATSPQEEQKKVQICFEILRLMQLLSVDLELMKAAVKEETLLPRLEAAKAKCKTAMGLAKQL